MVHYQCVNYVYKAEGETSKVIESLYSALQQRSHTWSFQALDTRFKALRQNTFKIAQFLNKS